MRDAENNGKHRGHAVFISPAQGFVLKLGLGGIIFWCGIFREPFRGLKGYLDVPRGVWLKALDMH